LPEAEGSTLAEVKPRLEALVHQLVAKGADRLSILYIMENEVAALRDEPSEEVAKKTVAEPSNEFPSVNIW
jgi:hypothetical protein